MRIPDSDLKVKRRTEHLFAAQRLSICKDTDRMFAVLMAVQWPVCVLAAMILSPKTWVGTTSSISNNVWAAVLLGGAISIVPIFLGFYKPGRTYTRFTIAVSQMLMSSLLIHVTGGRVETHFHIFGSLAFLSFYRDWRVLIPATVVVAADHILRGFLWPQSIYGMMSVEEWRWLEHAGWVIFEDTFLIIAIRRSVAEMQNIAQRSAAIRSLNEGLEVHVHERTAELASTNASLELEVEHRRRMNVESQIVSEIAQFNARYRTADELLTFTDKTTGEMLKADCFYVAMADPKTDRLRMTYYRDTNDRVPSQFDVVGGLAALAFRSQPHSLFDREAIMSANECGDAICEEPLPSAWLGVPIQSPKRPIGVLVVQRWEGEVFTEDDARLLSLVAHQIALSIERRKAEEVRLESEERFRDLFDNAPVAYHEIDTQGRYIRVNRTEERLLGYTNEELKGRHVSELVVEKNSRAAIADKLAGKAKLQAVERTFIRKDGRRISVLTEDRLIRNEAGEVTGIRTTLQDITAMKLLEEKVVRGQKLESIGQLAAGIAHEINTPTQYVGDNVRFLQDSFSDLQTIIDKAVELTSLCRAQGINPEALDEMDATVENADLEFLMEEVPKSFEQALSGIARISKIVQSMKDFAHPGTVAKSPADLNQAIESTMTVASNEWKYVAQIVTDFDATLARVPCHVSEINQVVLNMIINAAHSIADVIGNDGAAKGTITLGTKQIGDWAEIRITDTGKGIPDDVKQKVFDPFFTTKEVGKGTGQGLAIAHNIIVEKHGGMIDIESELGKGTTFIIRLPIVEGADLPAVPVEGHELIAA